MLRQTLFFTWAMLAMPSLMIAPAHAENAAWRAGPFAPLPDLPDVDPRKVRLGEKLFHDTRLSADNTISCASCHDLMQGGADGLQKPVGINGQEGALNTPTVFNSAYNFSQFWDGRAQDLKAQAAGPVHNPLEMGSNWPEVVVKLDLDPILRAAFRELYADGITGDNITDAIATFERTLVTVDSPFDRFLRGDDAAISADAKRGYELFQSYGCAACHQGLNVGGNMYQTMGTMGDYFGDRGDVDDSDQGRFHVTGKEQDRHVFKVPSLRMVANTAPYFHDGQAETLEQAVELMARYQLGREMAPEDLGPIVAFLRSLAGEYKRFQP